MARSQNAALFLRLSTDLKTKLHDLALARGGRKTSALIREVLEKFVEENNQVAA
jgi:predicted DNA-binding protein